MSLLTQQTTSSPGQYFFVRSDDINGAQAPSFTATGITPGVVDFVAQRVQDTGGGFDPYLLALNNGLVARWAQGVANVETGGNVGSDFVLVRYNDAANQLTTAMEINRANGQLTEVGNIKSISFPDNGNQAQLNTAITGASTGNSQLVLQSRTGAGATESFILTDDGATGFTNCAVVSPAGASAVAFTINNDAVKNPGQPLGKVTFSVPPLLGADNFAIPYVVSQTFPDQFGGTATITITPTNANIWSRPFINFRFSLSTANDDVGNAASITPSVQVGAFASQTGISFGAAASSFDSYGMSQDFILLSGTHYDASSTSVVLSFAVSGRAVGNKLNVCMIGMA